MVWIDGILQIPVQPKTEDESGNVVVSKGKDGPEWREVPEVPDWTEEQKRAIAWDGLPPLEGRKVTGRVVFRNVKEVWTRGAGGTIERALLTDKDGLGMVLVERGRIICSGKAATCLPESFTSSREPIDLHGGSISPGLMSHGSALGLQEIAGEPSTADGPHYEALFGDVPTILGDVGGVVRAVDALQFGTRDALSVLLSFVHLTYQTLNFHRTAYRSGVTTATSSLLTSTLFGGRAGMIGGLSTTFRTGSAHALEQGAMVQGITALHVAIGRAYPYGGGVGTVSVSEQIAGLRRLLFGFENESTETGHWFKKAAEVSKTHSLLMVGL
jgi:hypothetical protein